MGITKNLLSCCSGINLSVMKLLEWIGMSEFKTTIKNKYCKPSPTKSTTEFVSPYSTKRTKTVMVAKSRGPVKKISSRLVVK